VHKERNIKKSKTHRVFCVLCLLVCVNIFSQTNIDSLKITQLTTDDYETLSNVDINGHKAKVTKNYILIEDGNIWNLKDKIKYLFTPTDVKRTNEIEFLNIDVYSETAVVVYRLKSIFDDNGKNTESNWSESVVCKKNDKWKLSLTHSAPIKEKC